MIKKRAPALKISDVVQAVGLWLVLVGVWLALPHALAMIVDGAILLVIGIVIELGGDRSGTRPSVSNDDAE